MGQPSNTDISLNPIGDRPPSYDNVIDTSSADEVETSIPGAQKVVWRKKSGTKTLSPSLTDSPRSLYRLIAQQAQLPPRQYVHIEGYRATGTGKDRVFETQFDFSLDLTPTLLDLSDDNREWHELRVVRDRDGQEAFRGGMFPSLEEPSRLKGLVTNLQEYGNQELEDQSLLGAASDGSNEGIPSLMGWCERFCRDPAPVRSFTFIRELNGFDVNPIRSELKSYIRSLNYRGSIKITASIPNEFVTIYSPHWINRLRNNTFVWWLCIILQLWIVTWPAIVLLEKRYQVVQSVWRSSRLVEDVTTLSRWRKIYAHGRSEAELADFWAAAVTQAAWEQKDSGEILTEHDLPRLLRRGQERIERIGWLGPPRNETATDSMAEDTPNSRRGPAIPNLAAGGYDFQAGWGGNPHSTSS
ncbi:hypothetical protein N7474_002938 [Penicillium riverlandense]|uniref:uncharacterized protein n=1 Tax=Penicillium riverlandense TaxID=1903569 RepID=UPI002548F35C|nr:uncharacterized protein N7474_002938 [Penicillium riverlandense]KAJ5825800.1 hypothetical protein N7474_002938 [Penicillium riverlandense]